MFLWHIVCKEGLLFDLDKIVIILNLSPPMNVKQIRATLGHTRYYHEFIRGYVMITTPMKKLMEKDA